MPDVRHLPLSGVGPRGVRCPIIACASCLGCGSITLPAASSGCGCVSIAIRTAHKECGAPESSRAALAERRAHQHAPAVAVRHLTPSSQPPGSRRNHRVRWLPSLLCRGTLPEYIGPMFEATSALRGASSSSGIMRDSPIHLLPASSVGRLGSTRRRRDLKDRQKRQEVPSPSMAAASASGGSPVQLSPRKVAARVAPT